MNEACQSNARTGANTARVHERCLLVLYICMFGFGFAAFVASGADCPDYRDIQQPSVRQGAFHPAELDGAWYLVATTEPTLPPFCKCGVNVFQVHVESMTYNYVNTDRCVLNVSVPIKGVLSNDTSTPGLLHENFGPWNSTHGLPLLPNMVFHVRRNASLKVDAAFSYACLGRILGTERFSFNVLTRTDRLERGQIEALVATANASTGGMLEMDGLRYSDEAAYQQCGML